MRADAVWMRCKQQHWVLLWLTFKKKTLKTTFYVSVDHMDSSETSEITLCCVWDINVSGIRWDHEPETSRKITHRLVMTLSWKTEDIRWVEVSVLLTVCLSAGSQSYFLSLCWPCFKGLILGPLLFSLYASVWTKGFESYCTGYRCCTTSTSFKIYNKLLCFFLSFLNLSWFCIFMCFHLYHLFISQWYFIFT